MKKPLARAYLITDLHGDKANALSAQQTDSDYLIKFAAVDTLKFSSKQREHLIDLEAYNNFYHVKVDYALEKLNAAVNHLRLWQAIVQDQAIADDEWVVVVESGTILAHDWVRRVQLMAAQLQDTGVQVVSLTNNHIQDFAPHAPEELSDLLVYFRDHVVYEINDPVKQLVSSYNLLVNHEQAQQKVYGTYNFKMTGSGAYLIRKQALRKICQESVDVEQVLAQLMAGQTPTVPADKRKVCWNVESWHEYFEYLVGSHAYAIPMLGVEGYNAEQKFVYRPHLNAKTIAENICRYSSTQIRAQDVAQVKEELQTLQKHQQELNPEQANLLKETTVLTGDTLLPSMGYDYLSKVRKYVIAEPGMFAWQNLASLNEFFSQAKTDDFRIHYYPQNNDAEYLKFLQFHRLTFKPNSVPHHLPLDEYRQNYVWGQLIAQIIADPTLGEQDWVMITKDNQLFTLDWYNKLNQYLEVTLNTYPNASVMLLADGRGEDFSHLSQEQLEKAGVLPQGDILSWEGKRLEPLHLLNSIEAKAQADYQIKHNLSLSYNLNMRVDNELADFSQAPEGTIYLGSNEQLGGSLNIPPELYPALGKERESLEPELAQLVNLYWQITDIDVCQLIPTQVEVGGQMVTRYLLPEEKKVRLGQNGLEHFKRQATQADQEAIKQHYANFSESSTDKLTPLYNDLRQSFAQVFNWERRENNQAHLNRENLELYAKALTAQHSYLFAGNKLSQTNLNFSKLWPTSQSMDHGYKLALDWHEIESYAIVLRYFLHRRYNTLMLKVGALRKKAKETAFNPYRFNSKDLTSLVEFNVGSMIYANPAFSIVNQRVEERRAAASEQVFDPVQPGQGTSRLLLKENAEDHVSKVPAYLINLDKDVERLRHIEQQVGKGFFKRIPAVYAKEFSEEKRKELFDVDRYFAETQKIVAPSEIGCTLSHCQIYLEVINDPNIADDDWVFITEDDCKYPADWRERLNTLLNYLKTPYADGLNLVLLSQVYIKTLEEQTHEGVINTTNLFVDRQIQVKIAEHMTLHPINGFIPAGSCCYLVRKRALKDKVEIFKRPFWVADHFTYIVDFLPGSYAIANPILAIHNTEDFESNISAERVISERKMRNNLKKVPLEWSEIFNFIGRNKYVLQRTLSLDEIKEKFPDYEVVPKFDYRTLSAEEFARRYNREGFIANYGREPTDDDINRALQHQEAYRRIVEKSLNLYFFNLIIEDDAVFYPGEDFNKLINLYVKYVDTRLNLLHRLVCLSNNRNKTPFIPLKEEDYREASIHLKDKGTLREDYELLEINAKAPTGATAYLVLNLNLLSDKAHTKPVSWMYDDFPKFFQFNVNSFSYSNPCLVATPNQNLATLEKEEDEQDEGKVEE
ncbi:hypothetical protein CKF54_01175 [Psittacicella hinzii]|uniref:Glycosyl transferase family 25 domain-containing protein n=1 Tax=Psittacicella hinzii TaxID=2028575 RepID=A0A3A1YAJ4_9GAMM|nr:glycosyltransferase family 25 protein [Psittacicella hinzii]RIY34230.1 hypothetical protein CKF54_01175 [Psittacicella hinzii]